MDKPAPRRQTLTCLIRSRVATYQARQLHGESQKTFAEELTSEGRPISYADFCTLYASARKQPLPAQHIHHYQLRRKPKNQK